MPKARVEKKKEKNVTSMKKRVKRKKFVKKGSKTLNSALSVA